MDFPLDKELDKWKGMDRDYVLKAFKEYVSMNRWVKYFLRKGTPFPSNLTLQDVLNYVRKIKNKYRTNFIEKALIGYKNVRPQNNPQFRSIGTGSNVNNRNSIGINADQRPISSSNPYENVAIDDGDEDHPLYGIRHYFPPNFSIPAIKTEEINDYNRNGQSGIKIWKIV